MNRETCFILRSAAISQLIHGKSPSNAIFHGFGYSTATVVGALHFVRAVDLHHIDIVAAAGCGGRQLFIYLCPQKTSARRVISCSDHRPTAEPTEQKERTKALRTVRTPKRKHHDGGQQQQRSGHRARQRGCRSVDTSGRGRRRRHFGPSRRN